MNIGEKVICVDTNWNYDVLEFPGNYPEKDKIYVVRAGRYFKGADRPGIKLVGIKIVDVITKKEIFFDSNHFKRLVEVQLESRAKLIGEIEFLEE